MSHSRRATIGINVGGTTKIVKQGSTAATNFLSQGGTLASSSQLSSATSASKARTSAASSGLNNVIDSGSLSPTDAANQKIDFGTNAGSVNFSGLNQGLQTSANESLKTFTDQKNAVNTNIDNIFGQFLQNESNIKTPSGVDAFSKAQKETGILQKQQVVGDLTGQLNQIVATSQAQQLQVTGQGRGIPEVIIGGQQAQIAKEAAIQALPVAAQLSAAQGNLAMAESNLSTLFKIYSDDANNEYNRKTKLNQSIFTFLTGREQTRLADIQKQEDRAIAEKSATMKVQQDYAQMALRNNQGSLAGQIMGLNPQSANYQQDFSKLVSNISDPLMKLDIQLKNAQLARTLRETSLLGEPSAKDRKTEADLLKTTQGQNQVLADKITLIDTLKESKGLSSRVGTNFLSRTPTGEGFLGGLKKGIQGVIKAPLTLGLGTAGDISSSVSGAGQQFSGGVHRLASKEFIDTLIASKQQGATYGALSDREGNALRAAATQLNDWEIKNEKGEGIGVWNIDESSFRGELDRIKGLAQTAIQRSTGSVLQTDEQSQLNSIFSPDNAFIDPSVYYNSQ